MTLTRPPEALAVEPERSLPGPILVSLLGGVLERGQSLRFQARGGSMFPFIRSGDIVSIVPLDGAPALGDVLAFDCGCHEYAHLAVHRLVGRTPSGYLLRGDQYQPGQFDPLIPFANLLGRVSCVEHRGRPMRLGLGPERALIAVLSRLGLLWQLTRLAVALYRGLRRSHV